MQDDRRKLLVLSSTFPRWKGDEQPEFVFQLCRRLSERFSITVLAPGAPGAAPRETIEGIEVARFPYAPTRWQTLAYGGGLLANVRQNPFRLFLLPGYLFAQWRQLRRMLRQSDRDLVHAHWLFPQGAIAALALSFPFRGHQAFLVTAHGSDLMRLRGWPWDWIHRRVLARADAVTVVGPELEAHAKVLGVDTKRLRRIPMGVDVVSRFVPSAVSDCDGPGTVLFVGRLNQEKGCDRMVSALAHVMAQFPDVRAEIVGDGPERNHLQRMVADLDLGDRISFFGALSNASLPARFHAASVCVVPSNREGFCLVAVEAMACGRPIVASDIPSLREITLDGEAGLLVPPGDVAALAAAISSLLEDPVMRRGLSLRARSRAEAYSWEQAASRYGELIDTLTGVALQAKR